MSVETTVNPHAETEFVWEDIPAEKFNHVGIDESKINAVVRPRTTYWQDVWRRLKKNPVAITGLFLLIFFIIMSIVGPMMVVPDAAYTNDLMNTHLPMSSEHWFGTDALGRDIWARIWVGARVSLAIGFAAAFLDTLIGVVVGGIAGYMGGKVDMLIMRFIDIMISIPSMIIIGSRSFVPASSPSSRARFFRSSNEFSASSCRISRRVSFPLRRFCTRRLHNLVYCLERHLLPKCM